MIKLLYMYNDNVHLTFMASVDESSSLPECKGCAISGLQCLAKYHCAQCNIDKLSRLCGVGWSYLLCACGLCGGLWGGGPGRARGLARGRWFLGFLLVVDFGALGIGLD